VRVHGPRHQRARETPPTDARKGNHERSPRRHGTVTHQVIRGFAIDDQADDTCLYLGPARSADLLEVVTIVRDDGSEVVIHAMKMRPKYRRLLPGG
jgi:hypothetical protein